MLSFPSKVVAAKCERVRELRALNQQQWVERCRVREIMNNRGAFQALVGSKIKDRDLRLPVANLMLRADTVLGQKLGRLPDTKVDPPAAADSDRARDRADRRARTVMWLDYECGLKRQMPQVGRWVPGYGFAAAVIKQGTSRRSRQPIPMLGLRDPIQTFPGEWGTEQQPPDMAVCHMIGRNRLAEMYPAHAETFRGRRYAQGAVLLDAPGAGGWANQAGSGVEVYEYHDEQGCWWLAPEYDLLLSFYPNVVDGTQFRIAKRFAFDELCGLYDSAIGVMANMAWLALLATIATEDGVFAEALALDTPLPTPTGWTTMGDVEVGDLLLGADGLPVEVVKATDVQHDRVVYRVTFEDGTSIDASDGHLWESRIAGTRMAAKVRTTQQMVDDGRLFRVPAPKPWKLPEADLPLDPYVLGAWLGDGSALNAIITAGERDVDEMTAIVEACGYLTRRVSTRPDRAPQIYLSSPGSKQGRHGSGVSGALRALGLLGNKHVPAVYLRASIDQRLALLQGLMDTDGTVSKTGHCSFTNTNRHIADAVVEILRSLGEVAVIAWRPDERARLGGCWQVTFTARRHNPFRLARKASLVRMHRRGPEWVTIRSIERVEPVPVRCIAVGSPDHLFLAGRGAHVTHNTNIYGDLKGDEYRRGRKAVNFFQPGTQVERGNLRVPFETFSQIDRVERQLRVLMGHSPAEDGEHGGGWATGRGLEQLASSGGYEIREYQTEFSWWLEELDSLRLEYMDKAYPGREFAISGVEREAPFAEKITPGRDIKGDYVTRRVYGAMAAFDDATKIISLLQLLQADLIDLDTAREQLDGLGNQDKIRERVDEAKVKKVAFDTLLSLAGQGDPKALQAAIEMLPDGEMRTILEGVFLSEEEEQEPMPAAPEAMPDVMTVMSQLGQDGQTEGGSQIVSRVA